MRPFSKPHIDKTPKTLFVFIGFWVVLNAVQAAFVAIDADEAYYWLYARQLQWGYFDHPPLIALFIKLGETFGHGPFYTRLFTVLFSAGTVYFGFRLLPPRLADVRMYLLVFCSAVLFHVYSFIATPDAPLLFFTTLFFYAYRRYLLKENGANTVLLAVSITGLLYSKYHGVLPVFFTLLSHPQLVRKRSAWLVVLLVLAAFGPHLWWQYQHGWPTVRYHLTERIASAYRIEKTFNYLAGQLLIWGPFTTLPALYFFVRKYNKNDRYEKAHYFTFWGIALFFLFSSFRSTIEPHWTLVAGPSFVVLLLRMLYTATFKTQKTFVVLFGSTVFLSLAGRLLFMLPPAPLQKIASFDALENTKPWTDGLYETAQGKPVVFSDSYRLPALYQYAHPQAVTSGYNTVHYRKTQFNIWSDTALNNKAVLLVGTYLPRYTTFFKTPYRTLYLQPVDSFKAVNAVKLRWLQPVKTFGHTEKPVATLVLYNDGADTIQATNLTVNYTFLKTRNDQYTPQGALALHEKALPPGFEKVFQLPMQVPAHADAYWLVFSIVQPPLAGNFASPFYNVAVR